MKYFWFCSNFSKFLQFSLLSGSPSEVYFKQLTGVTFTTYLNRIRIERACELLNAESRVSIGEIASQCGYNSAGQFISAFKKLMGITPDAYRKLPVAERRRAAED